MGLKCFIEFLTERKLEFRKISDMTNKIYVRIFNYWAYLTVSWVKNSK